MTSAAATEARQQAAALATAEKHRAAHGLRLTPARRRALEILAAEGPAIGAYEVLGRPERDGFGAHPPVAYRALDFLVTHGLAHRLERRNAFVACAHLGEAHMATLLVCRLCDVVAEMRSVPAKGALGAAARPSGFRIEFATVEAEGVCRTCTKDATRRMPNGWWPPGS